MKIQATILNAFTSGAEGGNPAAVVMDADALTQRQKQLVAQRLQLSETAFVSASQQAAFSLEFFTPTRQIAHCGHATVAAFCHLLQTGRVGPGASSKQTIDGIRKLALTADTAFMEQLAPRYRALGEAEPRFLQALGLTEASLLAVPEIVNTGNGFALLGLRDESALANLKPDLALIKQLSEEYELVGFYIFILSPLGSKFDASARMFAPLYGIDEEAATGMAAGPLACYLYDRLGLKNRSLRLNRGG